jgi:putative transposase
MGLMAIYPKRNLSKLGMKKYIHPYMLNDLEINHPNQVWAIDITYVPMKKGFLYLTAIIDIYSRYVVGWGISNTLEAEATLSVLKQAINEHGKPEIINSDQGSQFTCEAWIEYLKSENIRISMDGKGRAIDNIFIERFWRSLKYKEKTDLSVKKAAELTKTMYQLKVVLPESKKQKKYTAQYG